MNDFCPHCGVANDLHAGPDTCAPAESKAALLEDIARFVGGIR